MDNIKLEIKRLNLEIKQLNQDIELQRNEYQNILEINNKLSDELYEQKQKLETSEKLKSTFQYNSTLAEVELTKQNNFVANNNIYKDLINKLNDIIKIFFKKLCEVIDKRNGEFNNFISVIHDHNNQDPESVGALIEPYTTLIIDQSNTCDYYRTRLKKGFEYISKVISLYQESSGDNYANDTYSKSLNEINNFIENSNCNN